MKITIDQSCKIEGQDALEGEIIDLDKDLAKQMIAYGRAHESTPEELRAKTKVKE